MSQYAIEMKNIVKHFGNVKAVTEGQFNLRSGEIHSLIGENGAGKSTMMKLLYGMYDIDGGEIYVNGELMGPMTPKVAIEHEIGMVHQEFMLVNELTVLENIILGFEPKKGITIDFAEAQKTIQHYIDQYGMDVQMNKRIDQISVGEAQRVEIIKILTRGANTIILDEPTSVLTPQEAQQLFAILRRMQADGKSIIFISHKLDEVMDISDRITVMRQSKFVGTVDKKDTSPRELATMMIGREVFLDIKRSEGTSGDTVLKVENLWTSGEKELSKIRGISLEVKAGEIVGIAGIDGNGQSEFVEAITGLRKIERGTVVLSGKVITNRSPSEIRRSGLAHIPENRNTRGLNRRASIADNLIANHLGEKRFNKFGLLNRAQQRAYADELAERFDIRPRNTAALASALSGGNAQKIVVAREVATPKKLLVASQPTRGIDIGAIESVRSILQEEKKQNVGVLLISADLEEILSLSDRILVMYEGQIVGEMNAEDATQENLGILMMGGNNKYSGGEVS